MARVVVTELAKRDIKAILSDLNERAGYRVAERYAAAFKAAYRRLTHVPAGGAPRQALGPHTRIEIVSPYIVIYDYEESNDRVTVLRVLHGKRNITRDLLR
jgi:plasmid stabilization system protein ParE